MPFDQRLHTTTTTYPAFLSASAFDPDSAIANFEDRLWNEAEAFMAAGAPSISVVAQAASIVRRHSDQFASVLSGVVHMKTLGEDAGPVCGQALDNDIASTGDRLIGRLQQDLAGTGV